MRESFAILGRRAPIAARAFAFPVAALLLVAALPAIAADPAKTAPNAFVAKYEVTYRGMHAGTSTFELKQDSDGRFTYSSRSNASGLFRLVLGGEISQVSAFEITATGVRPIRYRGDDGSKSTAKDIQLDFDWQSGRVTGVDEDAPVDLRIENGVQDPMSAQIALMRHAALGESVEPYMLADKTELKPYGVTAGVSGRLKTAVGELETIEFVSRRQGAKHSVRLWLAPSLGYIPVQAEQLREDKRVWIMRISSQGKSP